MRLGINHITKDDFLEVYYPAHEVAITQKNVISGFAATGLVPFNPQRVLENLPPIRTPSPPPGSQESIWDSKTPQTLLEVHRQARYIREQQRL